jgi:DNA-binding response OmpR family regulator
MYQILLVEDDKSIREVIADYMDEKGKDTLRLTLAEDGRACEGALERRTFDLILLDVMLPDIDGFTLCRMIRKKDMVPIVFLTAKGSEEDILWGYGLGCDDYIVKPFSLATLYAKILAILRRTKQENQKETITCGAIRMDKQSCQVFVKEREVQLQNKQYEILRFLMEHKNIGCHIVDDLINLCGRHTLMDCLLNLIQYSDVDFCTFLDLLNLLCIFD